MTIILLIVHDILSKAILLISVFCLKYQWLNHAIQIGLPSECIMELQHFREICRSPVLKLPVVEDAGIYMLTYAVYSSP